jgi:hypothetical protein
MIDGGGGGHADGSAILLWYRTCGGPLPGVCDGGTNGCPAPGTPCTQLGQTCGNNVGGCSNMICDDHDPAVNCPVSSAKYKTHIRYLSEQDLERLHDEALATKLATYNYRASVSDPGLKHLGFIIEDMPESLAVDRGRDRVDLYGYLSMVLATVQVQEREIATLREELEAQRAACGAK